MLKEMIKMQQKGKITKLQDTSAHKSSHNEMFKNEPVPHKVTIANRIQKHKKANLSKINKIHLKSKRI
jgi:hypothetical protein